MVGYGCPRDKGKLPGTGALRLKGGGQVVRGAGTLGKEWMQTTRPEDAASVSALERRNLGFSKEGS